MINRIVSRWVQMWHHSDLFEICKSPLGTSIPISNFHTSRTHQDFSQTLPGLVIQMRQQNCAPERRVAKVVVEPPNGTHQKCDHWSVSSGYSYYQDVKNGQTSSGRPSPLGWCQWLPTELPGQNQTTCPTLQGKIMMHMSSILKLYKIV